jgi:hypothetical protein
MTIMFSWIFTCVATKPMPGASRTWSVPYQKPFVLASDQMSDLFGNFLTEAGGFGKQRISKVAISL